MALKTLFSNLIHSSKPTSLRLKKTVVFETKCYMGCAKKVPQKCQVLFEWPLEAVDSQLGCRGKQSCRELMPGVPATNYYKSLIFN